MVWLLGSVRQASAAGRVGRVSQPTTFFWVWVGEVDIRGLIYPEFFAFLNYIYIILHIQVLFAKNNEYLLEYP